jgi:transposase
LHQALDLAWSLRNDVARERAENSKEIRRARQEGRNPPKRLSKRDQEIHLAERRRLEPQGAGALHSLVVKNIVDRIDEGWKRFWDALKEGRPNVRPPHPETRKRYRSLTYPQYGNGVRIRKGRVELSMIGSFRLHDHRKIRGQIRTVTLKWQHGRWWCIVTTQLQATEVYRPARPDAEDVGGDPGLSAVMTWSDGRVLDPPRALDLALKNLRREQRKLSRKFEHQKKNQAAENTKARAEGRDPVRLPLSGRLRKQIRKVGKIHTKVVNTRDHWHKLGARRTEQRYARVACEEHGVTFMIKNRRLARSASDRALSKQKHALASALGPRLVMTPNRRTGIGGNSQSCLCGASVPKTLSDRVHKCPECGLVAPRDLVSANIVETIAFGTNKITTAPGRGRNDAEEAKVSSRESAAAPGNTPVRAFEEASTSRDLKSNGKTTCGHGPGWKARPAVIDLEPLTREPKPLEEHSGSSGL